MNNLLAYLFGDSQVENEVEETKSAIERIMEEAEKQEPLKVKRTPLIKALSALGIDDANEEVEYDPEGFSLMCREEPEYRRYVAILMSPDGMEKLAKLGWVVTRCGDVAMSNEEPEFRIRFLEISSADDGEDQTDWPAPNPKLVADLIKKGREFATTPMDRDSENEINPVENPDTAPNEKHAGMGKEQDGKDPEGKPKGSHGDQPPESKLKGKSEALALADQVMDVNEIEEGRHKDGCQCGFCKNMGSFGKKKKDEEPEEGDGNVEESNWQEMTPAERREFHTWTKGQHLRGSAHQAGRGLRKQRLTSTPKAQRPMPPPQPEGEVEPPRYDDMFERMEKKKLIKPKQGGKVPKTF